MQGLLDVNHVVYFNTEGMLYKSTLFYRIHKKWSEINGFVFQEDGFSVEFKNKRTLRMVPYDSESQNLRVYLDKMLLVAKSNAVANSEAEGTADPLRSKSLA